MRVVAADSNPAVVADGPDPSGEKTDGRRGGGLGWAAAEIR
jgi:hypothetical protein